MTFPGLLSHGRTDVGSGERRERMKDGRGGHLGLMVCSCLWLLLQGFSLLLLWLRHHDKYLWYRGCVLGGGGSLLVVLYWSPVAS